MHINIVIFVTYSTLSCYHKNVKTIGNIRGGGEGKVVFCGFPGPLLVPLKEFDVRRTCTLNRPERIIGMFMTYQ